MAFWSAIALLYVEVEGRSMSTPKRRSAPNTSRVGTRPSGPTELFSALSFATRQFYLFLEILDKLFNRLVVRGMESSHYENAVS